MKSGALADTSNGRVSMAADPQRTCLASEEHRHLSKLRFSALLLRQWVLNRFASLLGVSNVWRQSSLDATLRIPAESACLHRRVNTGPTQTRQGRQGRQGRQAARAAPRQSLCSLRPWPHRSHGCLGPLPALIAGRLLVWLSRCRCSSALLLRASATRRIALFILMLCSRSYSPHQVNH